MRVDAGVLLAGAGALALALGAVPWPGSGESPLLVRLWKKWRRRAYGGLYAGRALESERPDGLFHDPLARAMAGPEAMAKAKEQIKGPQGEEVAGRAGMLSGEPHLVGRLAIRVKYLDDALLEATRSGAVQVVLLGAGMDTRAWRLGLPSGVRWFEVDQEDVVRAKRAILAKSGAALHRGQGAKFPLKAAEWHSMATNLLHAGWAKDLEAVGFDPRQRTVWLAEGLLNYLEPPSVTAMLREAAQACSPGSMLLGTSVNAGYLAAQKARLAAEEKNGAKPQSDNVQNTVARYHVWGCPDPDHEAKAFFADAGWRIHSLDDSGAIAPRVAGPGREFSFSTAPPTTPDELNYRFIVAQVAE